MVDIRTGGVVSAIRTLTRSYSVQGRSDQQLCDDVTAIRISRYPKCSAKANTVPALTLDAGTVLKVRPIDALRHLATLTALQLPRRTYIFYRHWAWLRYLGAFAEGDPLRLSQDAERVCGNQRRVQSEELGIGFSAVLAEKWCAAHGLSGPVRFADVDQVLKHPTTHHPGIIQVTATSRQPDYILMPFFGRTGHILALECKGTSKINNCTQQLARAVTQLAALTVNGSNPPGLAVSIASNDKGVEYRAVDPDEQAPQWDVDEIAALPEQVQPDVTPAARLARAALFVSNMSLSMFAGDGEAAARWLPGSPEVESHPRDVRDVRGIPCEGVTLRVPTPAGTLEAFKGTAQTVLHELRSGGPAQVLEAQLALASSVRADSDGDRTATSVGSDGAAVSIEVTDG